MDDSAETSSSTSETLQFDIPCLQCQYNLRGLLSHGRCPECGHRNATSILTYWEKKRSRRSLVNLQMSTLKRLYWGANLSVIAVFSGLMLLMIEGLIPWSTRGYFLPLMKGATWIASIVGAWLFLTPTPGNRMIMELPRIRIVLLVHLACVAMSLWPGHDVTAWRSGGALISLGVMAGVFPRMALYGVCSDILDRAQLRTWHSVAAICAILTAVNCCFVSPVAAISSKSLPEILSGLPLVQCPPLTFLRPDSFSSQYAWAVPFPFAAVFAGLAVYLRSAIALRQAIRDAKELLAQG